MRRHKACDLRKVQSVLGVPRHVSGRSLRLAASAHYALVAVGAGRGRGRRAKVAVNAQLRPRVASLAENVTHSLRSQMPSLQEMQTCGLLLGRRAEL